MCSKCFLREAFYHPSFMNSDIWRSKSPPESSYIIQSLYDCVHSPVQCSIFLFCVHTVLTVSFLPILKQNHCPTLRTACPKTIPQRILLPAPAPFTLHQTTEQQRRSGHITLDRHTHRHRYDASAPTRPNLARCVHTDEWRVGLKYTHSHLGKMIVRDRSFKEQFYSTMK